MKDQRWEDFYSPDGKVFKCEHFIPDKSSYDYELVKKLMEEHKDD